MTFQFVGVGFAKSFAYVGKQMNDLHFIYMFMITTGSKRLYFSNLYLSRVDLLMIMCFSKKTRVYISITNLSLLLLLTQIRLFHVTHVNK